MSHQPKVRFWLVQGNNKEEFNDICFRNVTTSDKVIYECPIDATLTHDVVNFYIAFVNRMFGQKVFTFEITEKTINWELSCSGMSRNTILLYLSAFRYIDELPEIIIALYDYKDMTSFAELFQKFQEIHFNAVAKRNPEIKKYNNIGGHGLIYQYDWHRGGTNFNPIKYSDFRHNLKTGAPNVHTYFLRRKSPVPSPIVNMVPI